MCFKKEIKRYFICHLFDIEKCTHMDLWNLVLPYFMVQSEEVHNPNCMYFPVKTWKRQAINISYKHKKHVNLTENTYN